MTTLYALIGPPAAGKTTLRKQLATPGTTEVNLDEYRARLNWCGCPMNQGSTGPAVELATATARSALAAGRDVVWDATNCEPAARMMLLVLAGEYQARTVGIVLMEDLDLLLARNETRDATPCACGYARRRVPTGVITSMHAALVRDLPTLPGEGWDEIHAFDLPEKVLL